MLSQTLEMTEVSELAVFSITCLVLLIGGLLGGLANYWVAGPLQPGAQRRLGRELLIGVIAAISVPSMLSLLSSGLLNSTRFSSYDSLRIFAVTVVFTMVMRQLFSGIFATAELARGQQPVIGLLDVEILRTIEYQRVAADQLPILPTDLRVSQGLLGNRLNALKERGLVDHRADEDGGRYWAVTKSGWEALNEILRRAAE
ncbi:MAG: hypothetical protein EBT83_13885 [Betaproteobacteria bacterium]|nr:hypothetical protein [Betaproteobacteria bacterium]